MSTQILTQEIFKAQKNNIKFIKDVMNAHNCLDSKFNFLHKKTCSYPDSYIVTEDQINEATNIFKEEKKKFFGSISEGQIIFRAMGMSFNVEDSDKVNNHRIRATFQNNKGRKFFVEFSKGKDDSFYIDFAIDRDLEELYNKARAYWREKWSDKKWDSEKYICDNERKYSKQPYYNYKGLEKSLRKATYTKSNLLYIINNYFDCNFTELIIDENSTNGEYISISK